MRSAFALVLLIGLCGPANATAEGHHLQLRHVVLRPSEVLIPGCATSGGEPIYRDDSALGGLRIDHDDPPAYDDPSKFGG